MTTSSLIERWHSDLPELTLVHDTSRVAPQFIKKIHNLSDQDLCGGTVGDEEMAQAVRAGLLLIAGAFEEAHGIVQELETQEAYYWHGIVHRREPDWGNAKYWFRRVGHHAVFDELMKWIDQKDIVGNYGFEEMKNGWDAFTFIDLCQACQSGRSAEMLDDLLILQQYEIETLLEYCRRAALTER